MNTLPIKLDLIWFSNIFWIQHIWVIQDGQRVQPLRFIDLQTGQDKGFARGSYFHFSEKLFLFDIISTQKRRSRQSLSEGSTSLE
jgi:hypothetical protein